jgi:ABC-type nitrate/sulfonate/bicarbonate transport system substrate-binding protein
VAEALCAAAHRPYIVHPTARLNRVGTQASFRACIVAVLVSSAGAAFGQGAQELSMSLASTSFATAAPRIAKELGLFDKRGLDPRFVVMDNASSATAGLIAKSVDSALSGPGEVVAAQARGQKVVVVANTYMGLSGSLVLSKATADKLGVAPSAPVAARLKALDGLVIASPSATGAYTFALKGAAGAAGANVRFTYMAQPAMLAALDSGAIQGFIGGAPFWAAPVLKGSGVLWISGPKGELPAAYTPASTANLQVLRSFADANPATVRRVGEVFADLAKAIDERPAEVKSAVARLYPTLDGATLDLLFTTEARAWRAKPPTAADMAHEIAFIKSSGTPIPQLDSVEPAAMLLP